MPAGAAQNAFGRLNRFSGPNGCHDIDVHGAVPGTLAAADAGNPRRPDSNPGVLRRNFHDEGYGTGNFAKGAFFPKPESKNNRRDIIKSIAYRKPDQLVKFSATLINLGLAIVIPAPDKQQRNQQAG